MLILCLNKAMKPNNDNYSAWSIDPELFPRSGNDIAKLEFFCKYAILAPSGHNSQPWKLESKENTIILSINRDHYLSEDGSGLLSIEPYVSLGCFIETLTLAAEGFGYILSVKHNDNTDFIANITILNETKSKPELLKAISSRFSNRKKFSTNTIELDKQKFIDSQKLPGISSKIVTKKSDLRIIAQLTQKAISTLMSQSAYRVELSKWVRNNKTRKYDGMPGFTHGHSTFLSFLAKKAILKGKKLGPQAEKSKLLIESSGALMIVSCDDDSIDSFISSGRKYASSCIYAELCDISSSALGASLLDPKTRDVMKQNFNLKGRPLFILRFGYGNSKATKSPRWPLEKVMSRTDS